MKFFTLHNGPKLPVKAPANPAGIIGPSPSAETGWTQGIMNLGKFTRYSLALTRTYWKEILAILVLLFAFIFFRNQRAELQDMIPQLKKADPLWLGYGIILTVIYMLFQAGMYVKSFEAVGARIDWLLGLELFLKRNFLSVFLPAGGVSSMAYTPSRLRKERLSRIQTHQASGLFLFVGLLTIILVGLPVIMYSLYGSKRSAGSLAGLFIILSMVFVLFYLARSLQKKGVIYRFIQHRFPGFIPQIDELFAANVQMKKFGMVVAFSTGIEFCGIFHIYIAMRALGVDAALGTAAVAYIVSVVLMSVSPFLKGLGAVELSLVYVLHWYGYSSLEALSVTMLYRVFEFWIPLGAGILAFAMRGKQLFIRLAPAVLIFILGLVDIISVVSPPLAERMRALRGLIPPEAIRESNILVLFIGLALLITSAYLIKGYRSARIIAIILSALSLVGNLAKGFDYEEAIFSLGAMILLVMSGKQYRIRTNVKWLKLGLISVLSVFAAVCIFGFISFYFIDVKHFGINFTWRQSLLHTARIFLLTADHSLKPITHFGHDFISLIRLMGFIAWGFLFFTLIRPYLTTFSNEHSHREKAAYMLQAYGNSAIDYFKIYKDKLLFFSDRHDAFMAYRVANGFAIVLEEPVCAEENKVDVIMEFEDHCRKMGLKPAFYRVDENSIPWFDPLRKQKLLIGQEAILEVDGFSLEGKDKKSLRNGLNSLRKKGYETEWLQAPQEELVLQALKQVSDEWLNAFDKKEQIFSQGMFDFRELRQQDIILVKDTEGKIQAFLNIIPDFSPQECTYDLIRKLEDAPGGCMDALIVRLVEYAREKNYQYINLGLVPMSGITHPQNPAEQLVKFAADKMKRFRHFQSLRDFKEKYATIWQNKYIIYDNDFDLLQLPAALNKVMQP